MTPVVRQLIIANAIVFAIQNVVADQLFRHFALWPLAEAAQSCFGTNVWPADVAEPHSWLEFDVEDVAVASAHLKKQGYKLLVDARKEPWGQTVTRLLSPEGLLVGITYTPWLR